MKTITIPTHELTGTALDWAVGHIEDPETLSWRRGRLGMGLWTDNHGCYAPSELWEIAGPIIELHGISLRPIRKPGYSLDGQWLAHIDHGNTGNLVQWVEFLFKDQSKRRYWKGDTALQAAMRCYVASKLGPSINVPQELQP